jgi:hypothetical protein
VGEAGILARRVGLLSPIYEQVALSSVAQDDDERFAFAIAQGLPPEPLADTDPTTDAIAAAFAADLPDHRYASYVADNRLGEALLRAAAVLGQGAGDADDLTDALVLFRAVGLEDVARRAALQLHLMRG